MKNKIYLMVCFLLFSVMEISSSQPNKAESMPGLRKGGGTTNMKI